MRLDKQKRTLGLGKLSLYFEKESFEKRKLLGFASFYGRSVIQVKNEAEQVISNEPIWLLGSLWWLFLYSSSGGFSRQ